MILGCDISKWQNLNYTPVDINFYLMWHAGARFVFMRAAYGKDGDMLYPVIYPKAARSGLITGSYFYLLYNQPIADQLRTYLAINQRQPVNLPLVIDYEDAATMQTRSKAIQYLETAVHIIKDETKRRPIIYTRASYFNSYPASDPEVYLCDLWVANYNVINPVLPKGFTKALFWQWQVSQKGAIYGVESIGIDLNLFYGNEADLYRYAGLPYKTPETMTELERIARLEQLHGFEV